MNTDTQPQLPRLTEAEARENMSGAYITLADGRTQYCEHLSERERKACAHADKLAEAARLVMRHYIGERSSKTVVGESGKAADALRAALAAYESETAPAFKQSDAVWIDALREMHAFIESIIEGESEPSLEQCVDARETAKAALSAYESEAAQ